MRVSLSNSHIDLIIIFLIARFLLRVGQSTARRRFQIAIVEITTIQTSFGTRPIGGRIHVVVDLEIEVGNLHSSFLVHGDTRLVLLAASVSQLLQPLVFCLFRDFDVEYAI